MEPELEATTMYFNWLTCEVVRGFTLLHQITDADELQAEMGFWMKVHLN